MEPSGCTECGASFQGEEIPEEHRENYGGKTHFMRLIGIENPYIYDGILFWVCPDCDYAFPRDFPPTWFRYEQSIAHARKWNEQNAASGAQTA